MDVDPELNRARIELLRRITREHADLGESCFSLWSTRPPSQEAVGFQDHLHAQLQSCSTRSEVPCTSARRGQARREDSLSIPLAAKGPPRDSMRKLWGVELTPAHMVVCESSTEAKFSRYVVIPPGDTVCGALFTACRTEAKLRQHKPGMCQRRVAHGYDLVRSSALVLATSGTVLSPAIWAATGRTCLRGKCPTKAPQALPLASRTRGCWSLRTSGW